MKHYLYKCVKCSKRYNAEEIENKLIYLCLVCGRTEKNRPLDGILRIEYDYEDIANSLKREMFLQFPPGQFWLYPQLWPLSFRIHKDNIEFDNISDKQINSIGLNSPPLQQIDYNGNLIDLLDDTRNPTLSYKDRATSLVLAKAIQLKINEISAASTGNAGTSLAGLSAKLGITSHIFVPSTIPTVKRIQIQSYGANIYVVDGNYDEAFDLCLKISESKGWYNRNTAYNPLTIEGKKSAAYDIFVSTNGDLPDVIFVPVGDGVIISGLYKGFWELKELGWIAKIPKLIAVQADGSNALARYLSSNEFEYIEAKTLADSISAGAPRNLFMASDAVNESNGSVITVTDAEILSSQESLAKDFGFLVEPAAAASFAGYINYSNSILNLQKEKILLLLTGNGLKDVSSLEGWNHKPIVRSYAQWEKILGKA